MFSSFRQHARAALAAVLVALLCLGCAAGSGMHRDEAPARPLSAKQRAALDKVQQRVHEMLVVELMRPADAVLDEGTERDLTERLRIGLMLVGLVWSSPHTQHHEVARTLGTIYATGTSLGWPGAAQLSELFLQRAVELAPDEATGWEVLGMLHLMTGDVRGAIHYLERARSLAQGASSSVLMALAQAYHLSGRQSEAEAALSALIETRPEAQMPRVLLELVQIAAEEQASVFRTPRTLQSEPYRPRATQSALALPLIDYRNVAHGFAVSVPWNWTLYDEAIDRELSSECLRMAYASWDMPLESTQRDEPGLSRVRVAAFPVPARATARSLADRPPGFIKLPDGGREVEAVLAGSVHRHWSERDARGREREGEVVFVVDGLMGFVLQYSATPEDYDAGRERFEALVRSFRVLEKGAFAPPGCLGEAPI